MRRHNGGKERGRHVEANRTKEAFTKDYAAFKKANIQTPQTQILAEIELFKASRGKKELVACCPLKDRETLERNGKVNLDHLFASAAPYNSRNNRGATVLVHLANRSRLLAWCRWKFSGADSHVVYDGRGGFYARAEIQVRTDRTHGLKCLLCMIQTDAERRGNREKMPPPPKRPRTWCENTECVVQNPKFAFRNKAKGDYQPRWKVCRLEEKRQRRAKDRAKKKA